MTRRNLMTLATRAFAAAGGREFFTQWLQAAEQAHRHTVAAPPEPPWPKDYAPKFFSPADFGTLQSFTEILIPTDETPGAREAHVAHFIDFVLNAAQEFAPEQQQRWREAMAWLASKDFRTKSMPEREALLEQMSAPERDRSQQHEGYATYRLIKQMTAFAFYTSRAGLVENLQYQGIGYYTEFPACEHPQHRSL